MGSSQALIECYYSEGYVAAAAATAAILEVTHFES